MALEKVWISILIDMMDKQSISCNAALLYAKKAIAKKASLDSVAPSIWRPMRIPHNPGGCNFFAIMLGGITLPCLVGFGAGAMYDWKLTKQPLEFYVWTYVPPSPN